MPFVDDSRIIAELRASGSEALAAYFNEFRQALKAYVRSKLISGLSKRVDSSDIVQDAYLRAERRLSHYLSRPRIAFFPWLQVMCQQSIVESMERHVGTQARSIKREAAQTPESSDRITNTSPSKIVSTRERRDQARTLIGHLSIGDAHMIRLRHFEALSMEQIGKRLGISANTASKRYQRALIRLAKLARQGGV